MPFSEIGLRRFRGFREVTLPLKPITVLLGPNSAGKSSFGHSIVALKQVHEYGGEPDLQPVDLPELGAERWPIDLGSYRDLLTQGESGPIEISLKVPAGSVQIGFGKEDFNSMPISKLVLPKPEGIPQVTDVSAGEPQPLSIEHTTGAATYPNASPPPSEVSFFRKGKETWQTGDGRDANLSFKGLKLLSAQSIEGSQIRFGLIAQEELLNSLKNTQYLKACRAEPKRRYPRTDRPTVGVHGQWTAEYLWTHKNSSVWSVKPQSLPRTINEAKEIMHIPWVYNEETAPLLTEVNSWMAHLRLSKAVIPKEEEEIWVRMDVSLHEEVPARALTDLGFGLSQVLPIIVAGLKLERYGLLIVEQPEAQLHPYPQAALADFFCALAVAGRHAIVETHSEMFFHRLRLRVALNPSLMEKIAVYFIDSNETGNCREPREISLKGGDEIRWPEGFLVEGVNEQAAIYAAMDALHRG